MFTCIHFDKIDKVDKNDKKLQLAFCLLMTVWIQFVRS